MSTRAHPRSTFGAHRVALCAALCACFCGSFAWAQEPPFDDVVELSRYQAERGEAALSDARLVEARQQFEKSVRSLDNARARLGLARVACLRHELESSRDQARRAVRLAARDPELRDRAERFLRFLEHVEVCGTADAAAPRRCCPAHHGLPPRHRLRL